MKRLKLFSKMVNAGIAALLLVGCTNFAPTSMPTNTSTPIPPTLTPTSTLTPTITPTATSTPVPIPPLPTFEVLGEYENEIIQITDQQGSQTTVSVRTIDMDDFVVSDFCQFLSFPLKIDDGIFMVINWKDFRRAYASEGEYVVTLASGQDVNGQLDFSVVDSQNNQYDLRSINSMVLVGLSKTWLPFIATPKDPPPGQRWQLHVFEPEERTFIVTVPEFAFEYLITGAQTYSEEGFTEFFTLELGGTSYKLSNLDEIRLNKDGQLAIKTGGVELTGTFFPILNYSGRIFKGSTPNWALKALWVEMRSYILVKNTAWRLTRYSE